MNAKHFLFILSLFFCTCANAQVEVVHLSSKDYSANGFGGFLNFAIPVSEGNSVTLEAGAMIFRREIGNLIAVPFLLGYRYTLDGTGTGFYVEPIAGYTIGASDVQKYTENGSPIGDDEGGWVEKQVKGFTGGLGAGYILTGSFPLNIGLRYQHIFVAGDVAINTYALRLSFPLRKRSE